ncbi:unnamed protein product [Leptosia nina]|uniref:Uncharacterized protein n=1 Tax=Leptosia nina TaxID=320188 RepID=A0AAV1JQ35_9NEOP
MVVSTELITLLTALDSYVAIGCSFDIRGCDFKAGGAIKDEKDKPLDKSFSLNPGAILRPDMSRMPDYPDGCADGIVRDAAPGSAISSVLVASIAPVTPRDG